MTIRFQSLGGSSTPAAVPVIITAAASDIATPLTAGSGKAYMPHPNAYTLLNVGFQLVTPQTSGSTFTVDIFKNGVSILSTKITITNGDQFSWDAITQPVISDTSISPTDEIRSEIIAIGDGTAKGLIIMLIGEEV